MDRARWKHFAVLIAVICIAPTLAGNAYYLMLLAHAGIYAIVAIGLCLLIGFTGQISLGHAAFFGLGGYVSAIITTKYHMPVPVGFAAAILLTMAVAFLIGIPALRLRGHYLAMATLGFGEIVYNLVQSNIDFTGGASGISGVPPLVIFGLDMTSHDGLYYFFFVWAIVVVEMLLAFNLTKSRPGRALMSIHGNEEAANASGVNTAAYKLKIFVLSAGLAALAGFLYAHMEKFIAADSAELMKSVILVAVVAVGGMANLWGTLVATVILLLLPEFLRVVKEMDILTYGLIIILIMIFMPGGLFAGIGSLVKFVKAKLGREKKARV